MLTHLLTASLVKAIICTEDPTFYFSSKRTLITFAFLFSKKKNLYFNHFPIAFLTTNARSIVNNHT